MRARLLLTLFLLPVTGCAQNVLTGIDVLHRDGFGAIEAARVGLITNHTGVARNGQSTIELLHTAPNVELVRIFSPEHGLEGKLDIAIIDDGNDTRTGIPVISLYGETRRPTAEALDGIDTLVFDIQDIGTRFYTYISTMGEAMLAAAEHGVRFVVLDRPNPINGVDVAGPVLEDGRQSFVAFHTLPVRHGMTTGELALMFEAELGLDLELDIVRAEGWLRSAYFDETGLEWINPSPNMRSLTAALLYPGIGLLETTNLSVGRGTATPFEVIGAPWLDGEHLGARLTALNLPGIAFDSVTFTPDSSIFAQEVCHGVRFTITDRGAFEALRTGLEIARLLVRDYAGAWQSERYIRLLGHAAVFEAVLADRDIPAIEAVYRDGLEAFVRRRAQFLLY